MNWVDDIGDDVPDLHAGAAVEIVRSAPAADSTRAKKGKLAAGASAVHGTRAFDRSNADPCSQACSS